MKTSVNIKMEENVRDQAKQLFDSLGLDMTSAVNIFLKTAIREQGIPFALSVSEQDKVQSEIEKKLHLDIRTSEQEYKKGEGIPLNQAIGELKAKYDIKI